MPTIKPLKPKKCRECLCSFIPARSLQTCCSIPCAMAVGRKNAQKQAVKKAKIERIAHRAAIVKAKSRGVWLKETQAAFNAYIRHRDLDQPCISCQRHHSGQYHAGHYRTTKAAPELRFCEINVWKQCSVCNNHLSGNILEYRINLIKKGIDVDWLEGPHEPKKYTIPELMALKAEFKAKVKG